MTDSKLRALGTQLFIAAQELDASKALETIEFILEAALSEAFARGQEKKASCLCDDKSACGLHAPLIKQARNQALDEAARTARGHCGSGFPFYCRAPLACQIAQEIRELKAEVP